LKSTRKMTSVETLALFLWIVGALQSVRQADNHFVRSMETVSRKFNHVLKILLGLRILYLILCIKDYNNLDLLPTSIISLEQ
jgi:hypothetical protein